LDQQGKSDEYTIRADQIENIQIPSTGEVRPPAGATPLSGTKYSDSVKAFNAQRDQIKHWSTAELDALRKICAQNKSSLESGGDANSGGRTLVERIDHLLEIVRLHPSLFTTDIQ